MSAYTGFEDSHYPVNGHSDSTPQSHNYSSTFNNAYSYGHKSQTMNHDVTMDIEEGTGHTDDLWEFIKVKYHPNGGASIVHMDQKDLSHLSSAQTNVLADLFLREVFREETECSPVHVMGVIHNAANFLPELIQHFATNHPDLAVKMGNLRNAEIETTGFADFATRVKSSYCNGTFRCGPLLQVSLVGQVSEEAGRYFPDFLG